MASRRQNLRLMKPVRSLTLRIPFAVPHNRGVMANLPVVCRSGILLNASYRHRRHRRRGTSPARATSASLCGVHRCSSPLPSCPRTPYSCYVSAFSDHHPCSRSRHPPCREGRVHAGARARSPPSSPAPPGGGSRAPRERVLLSDRREYKKEQKQTNKKKKHETHKHGGREKEEMVEETEERGERRWWRREGAADSLLLSPSPSLSLSLSLSLFLLRSRSAPP